MHLIRDNSITPVLGQTEYMIFYDKLFIYCNEFSIWWQWSVNLYKNMKETAVYKRGNNTQNNTKIIVENKYTKQYKNHSKKQIYKTIQKSQ